MKVTYFRIEGKFLENQPLPLLTSQLFATLSMIGFHKSGIRFQFPRLGKAVLFGHGVKSKGNDVKVMLSWSRTIGSAPTY